MDNRQHCDIEVYDIMNDNIWYFTAKGFQLIFASQVAVKLPQILCTFIFNRRNLTFPNIS